MKLNLLNEVVNQETRDFSNTDRFNFYLTFFRLCKAIGRITLNESEIRYVVCKMLGIKEKINNQKKIEDNLKENFILTSEGEFSKEMLALQMNLEKETVFELVMNYKIIGDDT